MKKFIKMILYLSFKALTNKKYYQLIILFFRFGVIKRYKLITNVKFNKVSVSIVDNLSFFWQYKEIFCDEIYKFSITKTNPVIIDCGANIGCSMLWFKIFYPNSNLIGFEADTHLANIADDNLRKNGFTDYEIIKKAVWNNNDGVSFLIDGADAGSIVNSSKEKKIESIRLKEFIEQFD